MDHIKYNFDNKQDIKKILVENSEYCNRTSLKNRLYKEGIKFRKCEKCGQGEEWNGEHMSLILDHINGINNDNRLENLRILCPNCNATLNTHCGKNKTFKTKILLEEIKELGYIGTGRKYGVSDNAIRKWIK